jgi:tetratricopeptide (TPR) repeat protein
MNSRTDVAVEWAMAFILAACFSSSGRLLQAPAQEPKKPTYAEMVASAQKGDTNVDYAAMRLAYLDSQERKKGVYHSLAEMNAPLQQKDFKKALKMASEVLETDFVDIDAHLIAASACRGMDQNDEADKHLSFALSLFRSIVDSGDGKTEQTAYIVISVHEEYVVMRQMGIFPGKQSLSHGKDGWYDVLTGKKDGQDVTLYFNITKFYGKEFD